MVYESDSECLGGWAAKQRNLQGLFWVKHATQAMIEK